MPFNHLLLLSATPSFSRFILTASIIFTIVIGSLFYASWKKYKHTERHRRQSKKLEKDE